MSDGHGILYWLPKLTGDGMGSDAAWDYLNIGFCDMVGDLSHGMLCFLLIWFITKWLFKILIDLGRGGKY